MKRFDLPFMLFTRSIKQLNHIWFYFSAQTHQT